MRDLDVINFLHDTFVCVCVASWGRAYTLHNSFTTLLFFFAIVYIPLSLSCCIFSLPTLPSIIQFTTRPFDEKEVPSPHFCVTSAVALKIAKRKKKKKQQQQHNHHRVAYLIIVLLTPHHSVMTSPPPLFSHRLS
jgi:hypothetical protein